MIPDVDMGFSWHSLDAWQVAGTVVVSTRDAHVSINVTHCVNFPVAASPWAFYFGNSYTEMYFTYHRIHPIKTSNSVLFSIFSESHNHRHNQF